MKDGSTVYGPSDEKMTELRTSELLPKIIKSFFKFVIVFSVVDGKLKMYLTIDNRTLLPVNKDPGDGCNEADENSKGRYCFSSGDDRANENLHLTSMHLIFARHHNYIVDKLAAMNPHYDDEKLFQEARRLLGAQMQHITYNEFLSVVLGKEASENFGLLSHPYREIDTYDEMLDPTIANVFAAGKVFNI